MTDFEGRYIDRSIIAVAQLEKQILQMRPLPIRWSILTDATTTTYQGRRRALISLVTPSTTVVADDNGYALSDGMAWQPTITAHNVAERAADVWCPA